MSRAKPGRSPAPASARPGPRPSADLQILCGKDQPGCWQPNIRKPHYALRNPHADRTRRIDHSPSRPCAPGRRVPLGAARPGRWPGWTIRLPNQQHRSSERTARELAPRQGSSPGTGRDWTAEPTIAAPRGLARNETGGAGKGAKEGQYVRPYVKVHKNDEPTIGRARLDRVSVEIHIAS